MATKLTDQEIAALVQEPKLLPEDYRSRMKMRVKRGHKEQELDVVGSKGSEFRVILRQSAFNAFDFSVILAYRPPQTTQLFRLRRYNGKHGEHTNAIEGQTFYGFHIHQATERYQELGMREDSYAEPSDRFADYPGAIRCMLADCAFQLPATPQGAFPFGGEP